MSKKYYRMNPAELLVFLTNFNGIADDKQTELGVSAAQLTELQNIRSLLEEKVINRQSTLEAAAAANIELREIVKDVNERIGSLNTGFKSKREIPDALIELLGLDADDNALTPVTPVTPTDLSSKDARTASIMSDGEAAETVRGQHISSKPKQRPRRNICLSKPSQRCALNIKTNRPACACFTASKQFTAISKARIQTKRSFIIDLRRSVVDKLNFW